MDEETDEDEEDARPSGGPATAATHRSGIRGGCSVEAVHVVHFYDELDIPVEQHRRAGGGDQDGDDQDGEEPDVAAA